MSLRIMERIADLTNAQQVIIEILYKEDGCSCSAKSKHIKGKLSGREMWWEMYTSRINFSEIRVI